MEKVRLGIIGVGNIGSSHVKKIKEGKCPEVELAAIADHDPARLEWAKENAPQTTKLFDNAITMMDSGLLDAVLVAVPHYDHPRFAMECFKRHLHVLVEKPAGVYTRQVREMNEAAAKSDVIFGMMFNQRTNCIFRKAKELVEGGELGALHRVNWIITDWFRPQAYYDSGAWRATWSGEGGGVLLNQCPHQLDLLQWICGLPTTVEAHLHYGKWHDIEVEDDVTAYMEFENGATGTFVTTTGDYPGTNRLEITLEGGKILVENGQIRVWKLEKTLPECHASLTAPFGRPEMTELTVETDGKNEQHAGVINAFAGAILHGTPLIANGTEGIRGLMLSNAMHLSSWLGRAVELPIDEDVYYEELMKRVATSRRKTVTNATVAEDMNSTFNA